MSNSTATAKGASATVLIVGAGSERFAIPHLAVTELVRARPDTANRIEWVGEAPVMRLRGALLPLAHLEALLADHPDDARPDDAIVVVLRASGRNFGVIVDDVFQTEDVVSAPLPRGLTTGGLTGAGAVLADGTVTVVLDADGLAAAVGALERVAEDDAPESQATVLETTSMLLFRAGSAQPKAVPLALVARIENVAVDRIETCGSGLLLQYRGRLMPLVVMDGVTPAAAGTQSVLVFSDDDRCVGLLVDEVVDIIEEHVAITIESLLPHAVGSAVLRGHATEIIDVGCIMPLAAPKAETPTAAVPALRRAA